MIVPELGPLKNVAHEAAGLWATRIEPMLSAAARYTGVPVLLLSTLLVVLSYRIAGKLVRTTTQLVLAFAIALAAAWVRGAVMR